LSLIIPSKVGKKGAVYLPKLVFEKLGVKEGDKVLIRVEEHKLILEFLPDPLSLALKSKKWSKISAEEFEEESERMQDELWRN